LGIGTTFVLKEIIFEFLQLDFCLWAGCGGKWQIGSYRKPQELDGAPQKGIKPEAQRNFGFILDGLLPNESVSFGFSQAHIKRNRIPILNINAENL